MFKFGWFSSGRDRAARDLLSIVQKEITAGCIPAEISFVFSNREQGEARESDLFFDLVKACNIPLVCLSSRKFREQYGCNVMSSCRLEYEKEVMKKLLGFRADLCVLAGYMLIVGEVMCQRYKMVNLHPALPGGPTGTWQEVIWQVIEEKAEESGAMMHLVTPELDKGPPVAYCKFPIRGEPFDSYWREIEGRSVAEVKAQEGENNRLFQLIREHELKSEFPLIISTIKAFSEGRVRVEEGTVLDYNRKPIDGYDLTAEIDV